MRIESKQIQSETCFT